MITCTDGPAKGVMFNLRRAPLFLRVVCGLRGWDALDQPEDEPEPGEQIYVYLRDGEPGLVHVDYRDRGGRRVGETRMSGEYRLYGEQPADEVLRNTDAWRAWCLSRPEAAGFGPDGRPLATTTNG